MSDRKDLVCGIVMPISGTADYPPSHWSDVKEILVDAIGKAGFNGVLVSDADSSGVIHKRIVQNLYDNPIIVCDVSGKNPNVMFELGMRLAFDKPTIIVKDNITPYSFDTASIEHVEYPRDLRFAQIVAFKERLSQKISSTFELSNNDETYTTFLKHFGQFNVAKIEEKEISGQEYILEELRSIRSSISRVARQHLPFRDPDFFGKVKFAMNATKIPNERLLSFTKIIADYPGVFSVGVEQNENERHVVASVDSNNTKLEIAEIYKTEFKDVLNREN